MDEADEVNQAISDLKEITESNISKEILTDFEAQVKIQQKKQAELITANFDLKAELRELKGQVTELKTQIEEYKSKLPKSDDLNEDSRSMDDIPFDQGSSLDPDPLRHFCSPSEIPRSRIVYLDDDKRDWNQNIPNPNSGIASNNAF